MAGTRVKINSPVQWGKLIKSWATGRSYFGAGTPVPPMPRTIEELKAQCAAANINIEIPPHVTGLAILQYSPETLSIRLPPKALVDESEALLKTQDYGLPQFYQDFFKHKPKTEQERLDFHACRLGEYSVNSCM